MTRGALRAMRWTVVLGAGALGVTWAAAPPSVVQRPPPAASAAVQRVPTRAPARTQCARPAGTVPASWLELDPPTGLGAVTVWVCLRLPAAMALGSYNGQLTWDSTAARALDIASPPGGSRVANRFERGRVRFAGAAPAGFADGEVLRVRMSTLRPGVPVRLVLRWREVNAVDGRSLLSDLRVDSVARARRDARRTDVGRTDARRTDARRTDAGRAASGNPCKPGEVRLLSLAPDTVNLSSGDRGEVVATGCGFAALNAVEVGPATLRDVRSTGNGTRLAFVVPLVLPAPGEAPPMAMPRGRVPVRIVTPLGASNSLLLALR